MECNQGFDLLRVKQISSTSYTKHMIENYQRFKHYSITVSSGKKHCILDNRNQIYSTQVGRSTSIKFVRAEFKFHKKLQKFHIEYIIRIPAGIHEFNRPNSPKLPEPIISKQAVDSYNPAHPVGISSRREFQVYLLIQSAAM